MSEKMSPILESLKSNVRFKKLRTDVRRKLADDLNKLSSQYVPRIPIKEITDIFLRRGYVLLQEDGTEFEGFFTGSRGRTTIEFGSAESEREEDGYRFYTPVENSVLVLTWYKMDSGNYEIVAYIS